MYIVLKIVSYNSYVVYSLKTAGLEHDFWESCPFWLMINFILIMNTFVIIVLHLNCWFILVYQLMEWKLCFKSSALESSLDRHIFTCPDKLAILLTHSEVF